MKKAFCLLISLVLILFFSGCADIGTNYGTAEYSVVCTAFPQYDWIKNLTKGTENISVTLIGGNGTDMHSYQANADDILKIKGCDLLVLTDGAADKWAYDAADGNNTEVVTLTELAGISAHSHNEHIHTEACDSEHSHSQLSDEHIWMSPAKAAELAEALAETISKEVTLDTNAEDYIKELKKLDESYKEVCENGEKTVMVVADRFPFAHLANDYNIECFSAFPGCSADTDASFETVIYLASKVDEYSLDFVVVTENPQMNTASAVIENTSDKNMTVIKLNSLQSVTKTQLDNGISYISVMEENLEVLKKVLSCKGD